LLDAAATQITIGNLHEAVSEPGRNNGPCNRDSSPPDVDKKAGVENRDFFASMTKVSSISPMPLADAVGDQDFPLRIGRERRFRVEFPATAARSSGKPSDRGIAAGDPSADRPPGGLRSASTPAPRRKSINRRRSSSSA